MSLFIDFAPVDNCPPIFAMQNYPFSSNFNEKIVNFVSYFVSPQTETAEDTQWTENRLKYASGNSGTSSTRTTADTMWRTALSSVTTNSTC